MSLKQRLNRLEGQQDSGTASFWDYMLGDATEAELDSDGQELLQRYLEVCENGSRNVLNIDALGTS
jgi:hypothetical protein